MATNINIKQMNWSDYCANASSLSQKYLIYIQDKNFYIQHNPDNYKQATVSQYFVIYGNVEDVIKTRNAALGLYLILQDFSASIGNLWYHDGNQTWTAINGGGGNVPIAETVTKEIYFTSEDFSASIGDRSYFTIFPAVHGLGTKVHVLEVLKETHTDGDRASYEPIVCQTKVLGTGVVKIFINKSLLDKSTFNGKIYLMKIGG